MQEVSNAMTPFDTELTGTDNEQLQSSNNKTVHEVNARRNKKQLGGIKLIKFKHK